MLFLVGTGLSDDDISLKAIEVCKRPSIEIYYENYTSRQTVEKITKLTNLFGKYISALSRENMEDGIIKLVDSAETKDIAILVGGDPLTATTHKIAYMAAKAKRVKVEVIHSASILTAAIGESGLDFYRFGQVCTIPRWSEHYKPVSFYETIEKNTKSNLHSLLLLDYDQQKEGSIQPSYAISILEEAEKAYQKGLIKQGTKLILLHNLSLHGEIKKMMNLEEMKKMALDEGPTVLILPAKISDTEREVLWAIFGV